MILILTILGALELIGTLWAVALCRAAARRPIMAPREQDS